jgi:hypothetical protein
MGFRVESHEDGADRQAPRLAQRADGPEVPGTKSLAARSTGEQGCQRAGYHLGRQAARPLLGQQIVGGVDHCRAAVGADADLAFQPDAATWLDASDVGPAEEDRGDFSG